MDNPEYTFQILEVFSKVKTREIPRELEEYISYVARTGDPVFQWALVKVLIKEKLLAVLDEFMEGNPNVEIPPCPNVDPFMFEVMKTNVLARLDSFILPPFTIQRLCELLSAPRKEYKRLDKYMRAVEKNVLVVSANDLSLKPGIDADGSDAVINGILYDKDDDSLNSVSNHVFSGEEQDSELSVSSKLDETDAVQQMIEESWNDESHDEFKINGGAGNSSLAVSFDNELQFVTDKAEDKDMSCESKESDNSFDSNSMLMDSSLQNIIGESSNITFESVPKPVEEVDHSASSTPEKETSDDEDAEPISEEQSDAVESSSSEMQITMDEKPEPVEQFVLLQTKTDLAELSEPAVEKESLIEFLSEINKDEKLELEPQQPLESLDSEQIASTATPEVAEEISSSEAASIEDEIIESKNGDEEESLSCGDSEKVKDEETEMDTDVTETEDAEKSE